MSKKAKSILVLLVVLSMLATVFTGCGTAGETTESTTGTTAPTTTETTVETTAAPKDLFDMIPGYRIEEDYDYGGKKFRVLHNHQGIYNPDDTIVQEIWNMLKKRHNIGEIVWEVYADNPTYVANLATEVMSGNPPDLVWGYPSWLLPAYYQDLIQTLDDFAPELISQSPIYIETMSKAYADFTGHWLGACDEMSAEGIIYNYEMIKNAGLADPQELYMEGKWDWATFKEYCTKLTVDKDGDGNYDQWGLGIGGMSVPNRGDALNFVGANGGELIKNVDGKWVQNLDDPKVIAALNFVQELYSANPPIAMPFSLSTDSWGMVWGGFWGGTIAMWPLASWAPPNAPSWNGNTFSCRQVGFPAGPDAGDNYHNLSYAVVAFAVPKGIQNPKASLKVYEQMNLAREMKNWVNDDLTEIYQEDAAAAFAAADRSEGKLTYSTNFLKKWGESNDVVQPSLKNIKENRFTVMGGLGIETPLWDLISTVMENRETPAVAVERVKAQVQEKLDSTLGQ